MTEYHCKHFHHSKSLGGWKDQVTHTRSCHSFTPILGPASSPVINLIFSGIFVLLNQFIKKVGTLALLHLFLKEEKA